MQEALFDIGATPRVRLAGKPVTPREWECIEAGMAAFNLAAGSKLSVLRGDGRLSDAGTRIGMRARQWPAVTPEQFRTVVERGFRRPWWDGRPGVGVVFNPGIFERLVHEGETHRGDEFEEYLATLGDDAIEGYAEEIREPANYNFPFPGPPWPEEIA